MSNFIIRAINKIFNRKDTINYNFDYDNVEKNSISNYIIQDTFKFSYTKVLDNPNCFTTSFGINIYNPSDYWDIFLQDEQFRACIEQLTYKVTSLDWYIKPAASEDNSSQEVNNYIRDCFLTKSFIDNINRANILYSSICGFSVNQIKYDMETLKKGKLVIKNIFVRNPDVFSFVFDNQFIPRLFYKGNKTNVKDYIALNPLEFITLHNGIEGQNGLNPFGVSEINFVGVKWFYIRNAILEILLKTGQRKGDPPLKIKRTKKAGAGTINENQLKKAIKDLIKNFSVGGIFDIPDGIDLEYLEANMNNAFDYLKLWDYTNIAISKMILSSTMTLENNNRLGTFAQAKVHETSEEAKIESKAKSLEMFWNETIANLIKYNFPKYKGKFPKFQFHYRRQLELDKIDILLKLIPYTDKIKIKPVLDLINYDSSNIKDTDTFNNIKSSVDTSENKEEKEDNVNNKSKRKSKK